MRRNSVGFLFLFLVCATVAPHAVEAQSSSAVPRIGILSPFSAPTKEAAAKTLGHATVEAFRQGLRDLGYVEGRTIRIEYRWAGGRPDQLTVLAKELVRSKIDVLVTVSMKGVRAARNATDTIPIVSGGAGDLVRGGLIASLARPGGNITGLTDISPELNGKQLELLKELIPGISTVAYLYYARADAKITALHLQAATAAARALGLELHPVAVGDAQSLVQAFGRMSQLRAEAVVTSLSAFTLRHRARIAALANSNRLPSIFQGQEFADAGGLLSYGPDRTDQWRRAALYVDQILKGAKPAELPVQQPRRLELVVNLKTANALGVKLPPSLLIRADRVIE